MAGVSGYGACSTSCQSAAGVAELFQQANYHSRNRMSDPRGMGMLSRFRTARDVAIRHSSWDSTEATGMGNICFPVGSPPEQAYMWSGWTQLPEEVALSIPAVSRGVSIISSAVSSMPLQRFRGIDVLPAGPLITQPEKWRPYAATTNRTVRDLVLYGWAWWYVVERNWQGFPSFVIRLDPRYVSVQRREGSDEITQEWVGYKGRRLSQADLIRFDGPDEGLLINGAGEILTALRLEMAAQTYSRPEIPTGVLSQNGDNFLTEEEVDQLLTRWKTQRETGNTAYIASLKYQSVLSTPEQLQLVQAREECAIQIARLLNLPARYCNASSGDSLTYSTVSSERRDLVDLSLRPYMSPIEGRLSMSDRNGSPTGQTVRFDTSGLLRADARERAEINEIRIRSGVVTVDEVRAEEGLPPLGRPVPTGEPK